MASYSNILRSVKNINPKNSNINGAASITKNPFATDTITKINKPLGSIIIKNPFNSSKPVPKENKRDTKDSRKASTRNSSLQRELQTMSSKYGKPRKHSWSPLQLFHNFVNKPSQKKQEAKQKTSPILTPENALKKYREQLQPYEINEIKEYKEIFYISKPEHKLPKWDESQRNHGWDDKKGFYLLKEHDHLIYRYEVLSVLGKGAFGIVYKCMDHKCKEEVAVKILRNKEKFLKQGKIEVQILNTLNTQSQYEAQFVVTMKNHFIFRSHLCIVFEVLSIDLFELIKTSKFAVDNLLGIYAATN